MTPPAGAELDRNLSSPEIDISSLLRVGLSWIATNIAIGGIAAAVCWLSILWNGRPDQYSFTACPTAFFISSLFLLGTGAMLGTALLTPSKWQLLSRLSASLVSGSLLLGFQLYGIWMLLPGRLLITNASFRIAIVLVSIHWLCCAGVLMLIALGAARIATSKVPVGRSSLLQICAGYWLCLGLLWSGLLCGFALLL